MNCCFVVATLKHIEAGGKSEAFCLKGSGKLGKAEKWEALSGGDSRRAAENMLVPAHSPTTPRYYPTVHCWEVYNAKTIIKKKKLSNLVVRNLRKLGRKSWKLFKVNSEWAADETKQQICPTFKKKFFKSSAGQPKTEIQLQMCNRVRNMKKAAHNPHQAPENPDRTTPVGTGSEPLVLTVRSWDGSGREEQKVCRSVRADEQRFYTEATPSCCWVRLTWTNWALSTFTDSKVGGRRHQDTGAKFVICD